MNNQVLYKISVPDPCNENWDTMPLKEKGRFCENCKKEGLVTSYCAYCESCIRNFLKKDFSIWTSGNVEMDELIQQCQMKSLTPYNIIEWIPYKDLENIKYLAKGGSGIISRANWIDGYIVSWSHKDNQWKRTYKGGLVALKCLHSPNITAELLKEVG